MALLHPSGLGIGLAMVFALGLSACRANVDYGDTSFACTDGECPAGYTCQQALCVSDDAPPTDPDAAVVEDPPDASPPDAQALAACDDAFSAAPGYELCSEDAESCSFNVNTAGGTCAAACEFLGSTCLGAFDNNEILCEPIAATGDTCDTPRNSEVCVCARLEL